MVLKICVSISLFWILGWQSHAQTKNSNHIGVEDGLTQGYVSSICQDEYGFIWIATNGGVNRFDGKEIVAFHHSPFNSNSIGNNYIRRISYDNAGFLWLLHENGGVDVYIPYANRFYHLQTLDDWFHQKVIDLIKNEDGSYLAITDNCAISFQLFIDLNGDQQQHKITYKKRSSTSLQFGSKPIQALEWTNKRKIIINENYIQICNEALTVEQKIALPFSPAPSQCAVLDIAKNKELVMLDVTGKPWFLNLEKATFKTLTTLSQTFPDIPNSSGTVVFLDQDNQWWVGTGGQGVYYSSDQKKELLRVTPNDPKFTSIYGIEQWNEDHLICFSNDHFLLYNWKLDQFEKASNNPFASITGKEIRRDHQNKLWLSDGLGIYQIDTEHFIKRKILDNPSSKSPIYALTLSNDSIIYFVTHSGIFGINTNLSKITEKYLFPNGLFHTASALNFHQLLKSESSIFLATSLGVYELKMDDQSWKQLTVKSTPLQIETFSIHQDNRSKTGMWFGTNGGGLIYYESSTETLLEFTQNQGLSGNIVYGIIQTNDNTLWVSTNNGVSRIDIPTSTIQCFRYSKNEASSEFNRYSYFTPNNLKLYFGGVSGMSCILSESPESRMSPIATFIKSIQTGPSSTIHYSIDPIGKKDEIHLELTENASSIQFNLLSSDFNPSSLIYYKYQIVGYDLQWSTPTTSNELNIPMLPPGNYVAKIAVSRGDGRWFESPVEITISVNKLWHNTITFKMAIFAITITLIWLFFRIRVNRLKQKQAVKDAIARDLHDEVGSSLSSIAIYTQVALAQKNQNEQLNSILYRIQNTAIKTQENMHGIIQTLKYPNITIQQLSENLKRLAIESLAETSIKLNFYTNISQNISVTANENRHISMIVKEVLNNTMKYAQAHNVNLTLTYSDKEIRIILHDDGIGFDTKQKTHGNGLKNMTDRMELINGKCLIISNNQKGTTIELIIEK